jgi:hypothetical protein
MRFVWDDERLAREIGFLLRLAGDFVGTGRIG